MISIVHGGNISVRLCSFYGEGIVFDEIHPIIYLERLVGKVIKLPIEKGQAIYDLAGKLSPVRRSVTGDGARETLR
jgi:hypothetical protein